jgi:hypothetical protein
LLLGRDRRGGRRQLNIGGSLHDPDAPVGRLLFNVLAMIIAAELP